MAKTLTRRDCLKFLLAANAAWIGSALASSLMASQPVPQLSANAIPIEGLGLSIRFTNFLRSEGITTIPMLLAELGRADEASRSVPATNVRLAKMLRFAREAIEVRLAMFRKSGPVPFATLTRLETEVRDLQIQGWSDNEISSKLGIDGSTIDVQLNSILGKMKGLCAPYGA
jgi:hypothetical protein